MLSPPMCHIPNLQVLTWDAAEKLVHDFVTSRLDTNKSLLYGIVDYLIDKLQLIQNNAASDHAEEEI